jgi:hypothetical protein
MTPLERICLGSLPVYGFLLFLLGAGALFAARAPVIVITDDTFSAVYGVRREHFKRIEMSVRLFRRIELVRMSAEAELDAVVFAVQDADRDPFAAVFPYRYYEAARRYTGVNPRPVTVVTSGLFAAPAAGAVASERAGILFIKQDEKSDFYRAGLCAALFSGRTASFAKLPDDGKAILVIANEKTSSQAEGFFEQGLRRGGSDASCVFRGVNDNYPIANLSCVVFWGPSSGFLYHSAENSLPNIVFSWLEPDFSSPGVKVVIDDSPLQLLPLIVKSLKQADMKKRLAAGEDAEAAAPSTFKVLALRIESLPLVFGLNVASHLPTAFTRPASAGEAPDVSGQARNPDGVLQ